MLLTRSPGKTTIVSSQELISVPSQLCIVQLDLSGKHCLLIGLKQTGRAVCNYLIKRKILALFAAAKKRNAANCEVRPSHTMREN